MDIIEKFRVWIRQRSVIQENNKQKNAVRYAEQVLRIEDTSNEIAITHHGAVLITFPPETPAQQILEKAAELRTNLIKYHINYNYPL